MKIVGIMPVRNEDWCLGLTLRAALMWCDEVVVLDHASTDQTANIIDEVGTAWGRRLRWLTEPQLEWREMSHRQRLLNYARECRATHIAIIDADEILTGNLIISKARELVEASRDGFTLQLPWLALARATDRYIVEGIWGAGQQVSMAFKDQPEAHWAARNGYDFHHRNPMGLPGRFSAPLKAHEGGLMHLQFLSERRLRAKQALYQLTEVLRWPGRKAPAELATMYGRAVYDSVNVASAPVPAEWWAPYAHLMQYLDLTEDKEPWQEAEVKRLVAEHGREKFAGLDLFGVVA
jgi:glycosyltransferase involved in cell wall biosynthesis